MLAFLTLTTPLLLGGLSLLALPLIAHWLHRRSRRTLVFPSIALLVQTAAQQSRFHKLKRWLLLALRLLAVACIVLAFTRPVWQSAAVDAAVSEAASAAAVIVVDISASTGQQVGGVSELAELKAAAGAILDELHPGQDVAGVVIASGAPRAVFPRLSANVSGLRNELERMSPTYERADLPAALAAAGKLLATHDGPRRLYVVSDLQRSNWSELLANDSKTFEWPAQTVVSVIPRVGTVANVSLSRPRRFPELPLVGEAFDVSVQVQNESPTTRQVRLVCERTAGDDSGAVLGRDEQTVTLTGGEQRDVSFRVAAFESPRQFVRFEALLEDGLACDNRAWLVVESAVRTPVLVVSDEDTEEPGTSAYYLTRALSPIASAPTRFQPTPLRPLALTAEVVADARVVVVSDLGGLTEPQAQVLAKYVHEGGGLVLFSGSGPVDRQLEMLAAAAPEGLLPWSPGPRRVNSPREPFHLGGGRWQSRWLRAFDEQSQLALQSIPFSRVWSAGPVSPAAEVLIRFTDGTPAVGVRSVQRGVVALCSFSPEATTSDLARHGAFVAFTQLLVQGAMPEVATQSQPLVGQPLVWGRRSADANDVQWTAIDPDGRPMTIVSRPSDGGVAAVLARVTQPGLYCLLESGSVVEAVAVAVDEREGRLGRVSASEVEQRLSADGVIVAAGSADGPVPALRGRPLWGEFFSAALVAIALELLLLGWWRR